ncbi:unnamed protein product [Lampetra planeri]
MTPPPFPAERRRSRGSSEQPSTRRAPALTGTLLANPGTTPRAAPGDANDPGESGTHAGRASGAAAAFLLGRARRPRGPRLRRRRRRRGGPRAGADETAARAEFDKRGGER